ncbi:MAG: SpoIID/LytB domain-containing protein [PVC group bacterium]|nr:SpoIID/LytB domain-containing protein [PVC group bacterium]
MLKKYTFRIFYRVFFFILGCLLIFPSGLLSNEDEDLKYLHQARILFNQGKYQSAASIYQHLEKNNRFQKFSLLNQALIYKNMRQYEKSISIYNRLLDIEPHKIVYFNLGEVYYLNAMPDKAIAAFNAALRRGEQNGRIHFWIGKCFLERKDRANAKISFQEAVRIDDDFALAHLELGRLYAQKKIWLSAAKHLEKTRKLDPSITEVYPSLAGTYFNQKKYELALKMFRKVAAVDPDNKKAKKYIDKIYEIAGKDFKDNLVKREEKRLKQTMAKQIQPIAVKGAPVVRVLVGKTAKLRFKCGSSFSVCRQSNGDVFFEGDKEGLYTVSVKDGMLLLSIDGKKQRELDEDLVIVLSDPRATILIFDVKSGEGKYWANRTDRSYRGQMELHPAKDSVNLINAINLEEYLYGVVPSEMSSSWPKGALKAQAVAARSEAYVKMGRHKADAFDFCSDVHCQAYGGARVETKATNNAVDQTCGQVAMYNNKPIDAIYCNSCGGHTQDNIFANCDPIAYLQGRPDYQSELPIWFPMAPLEMEDWLWDKKVPAFCNNKKFSRASNFRWMRRYSKRQLEKIINKKLDIGGLLALNILDRSDSSHIRCIEIVGTKGKFIVKKELTIRRTLGSLRSSMFNVDTKLNKKGQAEAFLFYGGGWGHAVGMCQVGAATMAQNGYSYKDILKFYYKGIEIKELY